MGKYSGKKCRLLTMFSLTTTFFLVEIIVGYATNSMALVADSFHMLSDVVALVVAFLAVRMSPKKWSKNTFGWARAEVLGALVNSVFLIALCFSIFVESLKRFYEVEDITNPEMILIVGVLGLVVNVIGLGLFANHSHGHSHGGGSHGHSHGGVSKKAAAAETPSPQLQPLPNTARGHLSSFVADDDAEETGQALVDGRPRTAGAQQMNMRGVFLHVLADAIGSVIVIISAVVIWKTDWEYRMYVDPALSVIMVMLILRSVYPLLLDSAMILLQTVPTHIQVDFIEQKILREIDGVLAVHEFHVWQLAGDRIIASAHIRCHNLADYMTIAEQIKQLFHNEGIHSTTIQPEFVDYEEEAHTTKSETCILDCPPSDNDACVAQKCCTAKKSDETESLLVRQRTGGASDLPPYTDTDTGLEGVSVRPGSAGV
ncbi:zinc transporter 1-like [Amphibalanus amphitrite]|uniref:zinc transporter 1-like n=1 Tax=Amphibalanus amphitrite TaxID=1232801 RepID=UPI001C904ACE|nr:zinc transporter 1-like [Amphibalanus amphitrite]XP_043229188.1 zinc transporter 1-like [Amphibalanus amphitrite]XP_043229189.1 zinc transporter 1-like [Amphibalanus amphitrite]XP_043229190.1 zinc transporter 1-like [Amphibalanus amphitrite]XP_043229191.1 zinc transporter 1-like [Amphibalanus amphitrite]